MCAKSICISYGKYFSIISDTDCMSLRVFLDETLKSIETVKLVIDRYIGIYEVKPAADKEVRSSEELASI